jgi:hypothetical protein
MRASESDATQQQVKHMTTNAKEFTSDMTLQPAGAAQSSCCCDENDDFFGVGEYRTETTVASNVPYLYSEVL